MTAMASQSASKGLRWFINQHLQALQGAHHYSERSKIASGRRSPTLEAHCQESCTLMLKSMPGLQKLVQHLADYVVMFGIEVESGLTQR